VQRHPQRWANVDKLTAGWTGNRSRTQSVQGQWVMSGVPPSVITVDVALLWSGPHHTVDCLSEDDTALQSKVSTSPKMESSIALFEVLK
jgi:hypothetical protein